MLLNINDAEKQEWKLYGVSKSLLVIIDTQHYESYLYLDFVDAGDMLTLRVTLVISGKCFPLIVYSQLL